MRLIRLLKNDLAKEIADWVSDGIISVTQAEKICTRYDIDYHQAKQQMFGYHVLISLAYLFVGLAVITLLGANWDDIPRALRMWGLIALTMLTQSIAIRKYHLGDDTGAVGIFLLGNLFFGASIILIAQIYHLGEHMPDGVFWWALGCLPIAVLIKSRWLAIQANLLALVWFFLEVNMGFFPSLFPLFIAASLTILYQSKQSIVLFLLSLISIACFFEYSLSALWQEKHYFDIYEEHLGSSAALLLLAYSISLYLEQKKSIIAQDYATVLTLWCLRFSLLFFLVMSFQEPWDALLKSQWDHQTAMLIIVGLLSLGACFFAYKAKKLLPFLYIMVVYLALLLTLLSSDNRSHALYFQIADNIILIAIGITLIIRGIQQGISHYFFLGIASVLLTALMRYIDLIGDYIGGAVLFMLFALLLIGAAKYWKRHQALELKKATPREVR